MSEFEANYFDFETADNFLDSISGTFNNLLPLSISGDESVKNNGFSSDPLMWDGLMNVNTEYPNPNLKNGLLQGSSDFIVSQDPQIYSKTTEIPQPQVSSLINSTSMSLATYSQDSNCNEISPTNIHSMSSTHTSPEPIKTEMIDPLKSPISSNSSRKLSKVTKPKIKDKTSHNVIEKKYRTNINSKILMLRDAVPSLRIAAGSKDISLADLEGLKPASKLNKASVLTKAAEYIKHLEGKNEILRKQNLQLQRLIQEADMNQSQPAQFMANNPPQQSQGFGYFPAEQSFNSTPVQQSYSGNSQSLLLTPQPQQQSYNEQPNQFSNKYLMGGMATVLATSLFSGASDTKGMSFIPVHLLPAALLNPSPLTLQLWSLIKVLLIIGGFVNVFLPSFKQKDEKETETQETAKTFFNLFINWILVTFGFLLPLELEESRKQEIIQRLQGNAKFSWGSLIKNYVELSISEMTFESCFLNLFIGKILVHEFPLLGYIFNRNLIIKGLLISNLEYKGDNKSLVELNKLLSEVDGLSIFGSESMIKRFINIMKGNNTNYGVKDGQNNVKFVEFKGSDLEKFSFYETIVNWRILEMLHQMNLKYLENLAQDNDNSQIIQDFKKLEKLVLTFEKTKIQSYIQLFKTTIDPKESHLLLREIQRDVSEKLDDFHKELEKSTENVLVEEEDEYEEESEGYDDDLIFEKSNEEEIVSGEDTASIQSINYNGQKSLISSLNLVNEEKFIILTCSLAEFYFKQHETRHAAKILEHLNLSTSSSLSLLSFTSVVKLIQEVIPGIENNDSLDLLIKIAREWLNRASDFMEFSQRSDLTKLIVLKGMILNGIENKDQEE